MNETKPAPIEIPKMTGALDVGNIVGNPNVMKFYANGFTIGHSLVDATIIMQNGEIPLAVVSLPFVSLKSLQIALSETIETIEKGLGAPLLDLNQTSIAWQKNISK